MCTCKWSNGILAGSWKLLHRQQAGVPLVRCSRFTGQWTRKLVESSAWYVVVSAAHSSSPAAGGTTTVVRTTDWQWQWPGWRDRLNYDLREFDARRYKVYILYYTYLTGSQWSCKDGVTWSQDQTVVIGHCVLDALHPGNRLSLNIRYLALIQCPPMSLTW